jgi:hypothetical protein
MTCHKVRCRWRLCPGCGHERRLARDGRVLCQHNRWEPAMRAMVPCEGSGQEPTSGDLAASDTGSPARAEVTPARGSGRQSRRAHQGAA